MPVTDSFRDRVMTDLEPLGNIRARAMFGGYGIFEDGDMFGLLSGSALFFKIGEGNRAAFEAVGAEQFNRMPYFRVPDSVMDDGGLLQEWTHAAIEVAHAAARKRKRKSSRHFPPGAL